MSEGKDPMFRDEETHIKAYENAERYVDLLRQYRTKTEEIKKLQRRYRGVVTDPEVDSSMRVIDQERHDTHLKLLALARELGRSENDVFIDILRREGNLEEQGLPEFAIFDGEDLSDYYFDNVKFDQGGERMEARANDEVYQYAYAGPIDIVPDTTEKKSRFPSRDEAVLVYDVVPLIGVGPMSKLSLISPANLIKDDRMMKAAQELGVRVTHIPNCPYFHDHTVNLSGLVCKKTDTERLLEGIRSRENEFRLQEKFFSEEERREAISKFKEFFIKNYIRDADDYDFNESSYLKYLGAIKETFGEKVYRMAQEIYKEAQLEYERMKQERDRLEQEKERIENENRKREENKQKRDDRKETKRVMANLKPKSPFNAIRNLDELNKLKGSLKKDEEK